MALLRAHYAENNRILNKVVIMKTSRREFFIAAASAVPFFNIGCSASPRRLKPSETLHLGVIGCGGMGWSNTQIFMQDKRVRIVVCCDPVRKAGVWSGAWRSPIGCETFKERIDRFYGDNSCRVTTDWRDVTGDPSVDAVLIATPDHWHAAIAIAAMKAGKHVYCQKPLTISIAEGREMSRVAKETGVTFQVGNQGRNSSVKRVAAEIVRNGLLGECNSCRVALPSGSGGKWGVPVFAEKVPLPSYFTPQGWNMWQGPAAHFEDNAFIPGIHAPMAWRWNSRYGGGMIPDFGAHEIDTVQWALGTERTGPVAIENLKVSDFQDDRNIFSWAGHFDFDVVYANGFRMHVTNVDEANGIYRGTTYHGSKGNLFEGLYCGRAVKLKMPAHLKKWREKKDLKDGDIHLYKPAAGHSHESDFIDGIYENRAIATDCEIGHRTTSICILANMCVRLGLSGLQWDPDREVCTGSNAEELNKLLKAPYSNGWSL